MTPSTSRRPRRRTGVAHVCPECREPWALAAVDEGDGYVVLCRFCAYRRDVAAEEQAAPSTLERAVD